MPSLFEIYKSKQEQQPVSDLNELKKLYNSYDAYNQNYGFADFVAYATENSDQPLDESILSIIKQPLKEDPAKAFEKPEGYGTIDYYKDKFRLSEKEFKEALPFKNYRRTLGGIVDSLATGTINFGMDVVDLMDTFGQSEVYEQMAKKEGISYKELKTRLEQERQEQIQKGVSTVLKPIVGDDIYDGDKIQKPDGIVGKLSVDVVPFVYGMSKFNKLMGKRVDDVVEAGAKKIDAKKVLRNKKINLAKNLASAELSSQVVFADNPEMFVVAGWLNDTLQQGGYDDNLVGDLLNYLDADEDSSAAQRRLSLLLDGAVFTGLIGTTIQGVKFTKNQLSQTLQKIKSNPKAVEQFKKVITPVKEKFEPFLPRKVADRIEDDVFVEANVLATDGKLKQATTTIANKLGNLRRRFFTSRGYYSAEMHGILKDAEYANVVWSKKATNLFNNLVFQMKTIAKEGTYSKKDLDLLLNQYLSKEIKLSDLPKNLQKYAEEARSTIDDISEMMLQSKHIPQEIKNVIQLNMGAYLRKSYELFENPNYKPSADVIEEAVESLAGKLKEPTQKELFGETITRTREERITQARNIINDILKDGKNIDTHLDKVFGITKADVLFATRKNIDEPFRKLFGERTLEDTTKSVFTTIETLGHYITNTKMYDDLYEQGRGKWFFDETTNIPKTQARTAASIQGERFASLNGVQTTPQIARFFDETQRGMLELSNLSKLPVMRTILAMKGFGQAFATVYSLTTHARNTIGGGIIMASNGLNPFDKETRNAFKTLKNELYTTTKNKDEALTNLYNRYQELGLVNQNIRVNEFKKLINENMDGQWIQKLDEQFTNVAFQNVKQGLTNSVKEVNKTFNKTYVAEDDLWRIAAFQKELDVLKRAYPNRAVAELEKEAATIIRNTFPTYDLVPLGARELRQIPIFGNFYSFFAERWRNNYHTLTRGIQEIRSENPELIERGYKRLASKTAVGYVGAEGLNSYTKHAYGISDEEEKAIRDLTLPPWSKNGTLAFKRDEFGNIMYVDLTFSDPDAPVLNTIKAFTNEIFDPKTPLETIDKRIAEGLNQSLKTFLEPFTDQPLFTGRIIEVLDGKDENGRFIPGYNPQQGEIENFFAKSKYVGETLIPRFLKEGASYTWGEGAEKIKEGDTTYAEVLVGKLTGQNFYTITKDKLETSLFFKMRDFSKAQGESKLLLDIRNAETTDDLLQNYLGANKAYYRNYVNMYQAIQAAKTLNLERSTIEKIARNNLGKAGLNKKEIKAMLSGDNYFQPIRLTDADLKTIYDQTDYVNISADNFKRQYNILYNKLSNLPLLELPEEELSEKEKEAIALIRKTKATGGLVEGPEVPFTKEDPADRVDPFTGLPYQEQMDRLGFISGGPTLLHPENKEYFTKFHNDVVSQGKELTRDNETVTMRIIGVNHEGKEYLIPSYDPDSKKVLSDKDAKQKYLQDIKSGKLKGYDTIESAERDRQIFYPEIVGK